MSYVSGLSLGGNSDCRLSHLKVWLQSIIFSLPQWLMVHFKCGIERAWNALRICFSGMNLLVFLNCPKTLVSRKIRFLQIMHYVQHLIPHSPHKPLDNPVDAFLSIHPPSKGIMSTLYNLVSKLHCSSVVAIRTVWEQDPNFSFTEELWDLILNQVQSSSMCTHHVLLQFKVIHCICLCFYVCFF